MKETPKSGKGRIRDTTDEHRGEAYEFLGVKAPKAESGIWAAAGNQDGRYGVMLGDGRKVLRFIPETQLTPEHLAKVPAGNCWAELVRRAIEDLPRLKA